MKTMCLIAAALLPLSGGAADMPVPSATPRPLTQAEVIARVEADAAKKRQQDYEQALATRDWGRRHAAAEQRKRIASGRIKQIVTDGMLFTSDAGAGISNPTAEFRRYIPAGLIFLRFHGSGKADGDWALYTVEEDGTYTYDTVGGATRTLHAFKTFVKP